MFGLESPELLNRRRICQGTAGFQVGQEYFFGWIHNLGGLSHKVYAGKHNDIGIGLSSFLGKAQAIADIIGHILNIRLLVIVRQQNRIFFFFQSLNLGK